MRVAVALALVVALSAHAWGGPAPGQFGLADAGFPSAPDDAHATPGFARPHPSVVRIIVHEGQGRMSLGSGTLVDVRGQHALVLTNWHVVCEARGPVQVVFPDGFRTGASVLLTDRDWDLAALAIWRPQALPVTLASRVPQPGDPLSIAGYGSGDYRAAAGRCVQYLSPGGNHPFELIELSTAARQGDSGGPIFNARGELAGVLFGSALGRTSGSHSGRVRQFLARVQPRFEQLDAEPQWIAATRLPPGTASGAGAAPVVAAANQPTMPIGDTAYNASPATGWQQAPPRHSPEPAAETATAPPKPVATLRNAPPVAQAAPSEPAKQPALSEFASAGPVPREIPSTVAAPPPTSPLTWEDLAGQSRGEQVKTLLALLGAASVLGHLIRLLGGGPREEAEAPPPPRPKRKTSSSASRSA